MTPEGAGRRFLRAILAARMAALAIVGPVIGVLVVSATFGLGAAMLPFALAMLLFALALLGVLVRAEYRRLPPGGTAARR